MRFLIILLSLLPLFYLGLHFTFNLDWHFPEAIAKFFNHYTFITFHLHLKHPQAFIHDVLGLSATILLITTLLVTPLNSYLKISFYRHRRLLGIITFFYALAHFLVYFIAIQDASVNNLLYAISHKSYIIFGVITFSVITLMALTSNSALYDKFNAWHKLIYFALITLSLHILLSQKSIEIDSIIYVSIFVSLLALRTFKRG